jgi:hypothetical protein
MCLRPESLTANPVGELRVSASRYAAGEAATSTTYFILFAGNNTRYELNLKGSNIDEWKTGMRIRVKALKIAAAAALPTAASGTVVSPIQFLNVTEVVVLASPAPSALPTSNGVNSGVAATFTAPVQPGIAPANLAVLFIIIATCDLSASITPEVRGSYELWA